MSACRKFAKNSSGSVALFFVIALAVVVLSLGAASDYLGAMASKGRIQEALDAAALGAVQNVGIQSDSNVVRLANAIFADDLKATLERGATATAQIDDTHGFLTLSTSFPVKTNFMQLFGINSIPLNLHSKARNRGGPPCVIVLDPTASGSLTVSGSGSVLAPNCTVYVDSSSLTAISQTGNAGSLSARAVYITGSYATGSNISPTPKTNQLPFPDPLASIAEPTVPNGCDYNNTKVGNSTTFPGGSVYCGNISFGADVTLQPGIHYFRSANVSIGSNVNMTGSGVMLYFDKNSTLTKSVSSGQVNLSPMTSGPYQGILFFGSRAGTSMQTFRLAGGTGYSVAGTVYLPNAKLSFYGNSSITLTSKSGYLIARQLYYQGSSSLVVDTVGTPTPTVYNSSSTALLE